MQISSAALRLLSKRAAAPETSCRARLGMLPLPRDKPAMRILIPDNILYHVPKAILQLSISSMTKLLQLAARHLLFSLAANPHSYSLIVDRVVPWLVQHHRGLSVPTPSYRRPKTLGFLSLYRRVLRSQLLNLRHPHQHQA